MSEQEEDEEDLVPHGRHDEEVDGDDLRMWFLRKARQVAEGGFRRRTMYFATVDFGRSMPILPSSPTIRGAPQSGLADDMRRIRSRTSLGDRWPPRLPRPTQLRPVLPELPSSPGDDGLGLDEDQGLAPAGPVAGEPGPEDAIGGLQPRSGAGPLVDGELMSERQDLDLHGEPGPEQAMDERHGGA